MMRTRFWPSALIAVSMWLTATAAQAHPHVWATMVTELLYAPDGSANAVRQAWTFDDMFSAFATTGIQAKTKGQFTRGVSASRSGECRGGGQRRRPRSSRCI
jgi:ABC-type uncharacterized transport system substrate-binding protein